LTDNLGLVELFCGWKMGTMSIVHQDSVSVITLVTQEGDILMTRHRRALLHLAKENLEERRMLVQHIKMDGMIADGESKPLKGKDCIKSCTFVQGSFNHTR
jgi:hypothetical protein